MPFKYSLNSLVLGSPLGTHIRIGRNLPAELVAAGFQAALVYYWQGETNGYFYDGIRNPGPGPTNAIREWGTVTSGTRIRQTQTQMNGGSPTQYYIGSHIFSSLPEAVTNYLLTGTNGSEHNIGPRTRFGDGQIASSHAFWGMGTLVLQTRRASTTNVNSGSNVSWDAIDYNGSTFLVGTTFTPDISGWYEISGKVRMGPQASGTVQQVNVLKNGSAVNSGLNSEAANSSGTAGNSIPIGPIMVYLTAGTDSITIQGSNALAAALSWGGSVLIIKYFGNSSDGSATPT